ncbi:MAG TPA: PEP-CTERM sorting domain-containing protein, partial [Phycisphaerae bacterium]|nr:PEP-CTERM sorting domain-containing protein [Phycisphaerae bacterium]
ATDLNALYSSDMATHGGIEQNGGWGNYTYSVKSISDFKSDGVTPNNHPDRDSGTGLGWTNIGVNYIQWEDTLRFANWMHNGQPTGAQDASTTEDGAYDMSLGGGLEAVRKAGATYFVPSEDEWYKAAYYKSGGTNAGYWDYATQSDAVPVEEKPPGGANSAMYSRIIWPWDPNIASVGSYTGSPSPYGTFDQNGSMWEWLEESDAETVDPLKKVLRSGDWWNEAIYLSASHQELASPAWNTSIVGFRLAEPQTEEVLLPGDANRDGVVSADDYGSVQLHFGDTGDAGILGDANGDGVVSADDYGSVQLHFGDMAGLPVPEPGTIGLLAMGMVAILRKRK